MTAAYKVLRAMMDPEIAGKEFADRAGGTLRVLMLSRADLTDWDAMDWDGGAEEDWVHGRSVATFMAQMLGEVGREELTEFALGQSLCPLHLVDYAICFDDANPECKAIREVWPGHDT